MTKAYSIMDRYGRDQIDPKYRALEAEWYAKLRETGFVDIESYGNPFNTYLHEHHIESRKAVERGVNSGKAEFFRLLNEWLDVGHHRTRAERWSLAAWCSGFNAREIAGHFPKEVGIGSASALAKRLELRGARAMEYHGVTP